MSKFIIIFLMLLFSGNCFAAGNEGAEIKLNSAPAHHLTIKEQVIKEQKSLLLNNDKDVDAVVDRQKEKDFEDLDLLWKATVEKSNLIKFALKKLSTPESERRIHSSLMAKSLSALISGASFIPGFIGSNYSLQTLSFATGRLAHNYINQKTSPKEMPLNDTELIELAGMIETLQNSVINSYYNYKTSLNELKQVRTRLVLYNKNYSKAIQSNNSLEMIISGALYDNMLTEENRAKQNAKKYQLELERLTNRDTVQKLNLYQDDVGQKLIKQNLVTVP